MYMEDVIRVSRAQNGIVVSVREKNLTASLGSKAVEEYEPSTDYVFDDAEEASTFVTQQLAKIPMTETESEEDESEEMQKEKFAIEFKRIGG